MNKGKIETVGGNAFDYFLCVQKVIRRRNPWTAKTAIIK
jgi:hypothetical protein